MLLVGQHAIRFSSVTFVGINQIWAFISTGDIPTLICVCCPIESYGKKK
jgi:hypothetical protein